MTFNSFAYLLFLPAVYLSFYATADRWRWLLLLLASYGFYASFRAPYLLAVLFLVTCIGYACGLRIAAAKDDSTRSRWLRFGSCACLALLALLKYQPFWGTFALPGRGPLFSLTLIGVGVSYFAFQAISYLADVYLETAEPERHFGHFALYLAFFPKLLQGPIERAGDLLPQLKRPYRFDYDAMRSGLLLFTWGLFKKVVLADRLALYADQVYNNPGQYSAAALLFATYAFALQIYFDFAGYTDMARGAGRLFGIRLTENFNAPYLATSIADFWRRWHISFSRWILDYIFKPLQMSWRDWGRSGTGLALICTFLVSGLWHGASWGYLVWGLLHGIYLASSTYYRPYQKKIYRLLGIEASKWLGCWQILVTFNLVSFSWIFFRGGSAGGWYVVKRVSGALLRLDWPANAGLKATGIAELVWSKGKINALVIVVALASMACLRQLKDRIRFFDKPMLFRWSVYLVLTMVTSIFAMIGQGNFLYLKF